jgi:hypothetical protein
VPAAAPPKRFGFLFPTILVAFLAPIFALLIQAHRVPDRYALPPPQVQRPLTPLWVAALSSPQPSTVEFTLPELNFYLSQALLAPRPTSKNSSLQRVSVELEPGRCHVRTLHQWRGRDLFLNATYQVAMKSGKIRFQLVSGSLGRLELSAFWMSRLEQSFLQMLPALRRERVLFDRLSDFQISAERVVLRVRASGGG